MVHATMPSAEKTGLAISWRGFYTDIIPSTWFANVGSFRSRHPVQGDDFSVLAECRLLVRDRTATLTYPASAANVRNGIDQGQTVIRFVDAARAAVESVAWGPYGSAQLLPRKVRNISWPQEEPKPGLVSAAAKLPLVANLDELIGAVATFDAASKSEQLDVMGNHPKFFVHVQTGRKHLFGLSKFVAFNEISVDDYCEEMWTWTSGTPARNHIETLTGRTWISLAKVAHPLRDVFTTWLAERRSSPANLNDLFLLSLGPQKVPPTRAGKGRQLGRRELTPEQLAQKLERQSALGKAGEIVACRWEIKRLTKDRVVDAAKKVKHTAKKNVAAGYDIESDDPRGRRFIEVKSCTTRRGRFFLSENETQVLECLGGQGFLYLVHVTRVKPPQGKVVEMIQDPISRLKRLNKLRPVVYEVKLPEGIVAAESQAQRGKT